jgi:hypothetical protein
MTNMEPASGTIDAKVDSTPAKGSEDTTAAQKPVAGANNDVAEVISTHRQVRADCEHRCLRCKASHHARLVGRYQRLARRRCMRQPWCALCAAPTPATVAMTAMMMGVMFSSLLCDRLFDLKHVVLTGMPLVAVLLELAACVVQRALSRTSIQIPAKARQARFAECTASTILICLMFSRP